MQKIFSVLVGLGIIGYLIYVLILALQIVLETSSDTWPGISLHLIAAGILIAIILAGHFFAKNQEEETKGEKQSSPIPENVSNTQTKSSYNPFEDKLDFGVYRQEFTTWWYDNDGDKHEQDTIYANLRFYEDGTVIGVRDSSIPKLEVPGSFTMKGTYILDEEKITLSLEKMSDVDDSIKTYIPEEDKREMKYYGEIADDESLIKAGTYKGKIQGNTLIIGNFTFLKLAISKLIVTADENTCDQLELTVKKHPHVITTFQDTGNWYTNGETGPEWFTVHIETSQDWEKEVEAYVNSELKRMGESANNMFWG